MSVDDNVLGFAEMTIKLGEMMDSRGTRMAAITGQARGARAEGAAGERRRSEGYAKMAALREEIATLYASAMPAIEAISKGEGEIEVTEQRRLQRAELQLPQDVRRARVCPIINGRRCLPPACGGGGGRMPHPRLVERSAPAQSATFLQLLEQEVCKHAEGRRPPPPPKPVPLPREPAAGTRARSRRHGRA